MTSTRNGPRFGLDDQVYFSTQNLAARQQPSDRFVIVQIMPQDRAGIYQYRIRPVGAGPQRVATELELRR
jgi:hypothetical protein